MRRRGDAPLKSSLTSLAASTLAGLSVLGFSDESSEITLSSCQSVSKVRALTAIGNAYDGFDSVDREPSFTRVFVTVLVLTGRMLQNV